MDLHSLAPLFRSGPLHSVLLGMALAGMALAILIWAMEFSGWTISRQGFVRNNMAWDATTTALIAVSAAIYIAGRPLQLQLIPGIGGINPTLSLAPIFAVLFGLPGAIGVTFSMPIGDAISGALTVGSVAGFLSHTFITWLPYKMVREPDFKAPAAIVSFFVWAIFIGPLIHTVIIPGWLDFTHVLPTAVAWGALTLVILMNHMVTPAIIAPILMVMLYPSVKARGLYWRDRYQPGGTRRASSPASFALATDAAGGDGGALPAPILVVDDLHFTYPTGQHEALAGISFTVSQGELIGITGPSGAGKSTLALCLRGLIPHSVSGRMEGRVTLCGMDTREAGPAAIGERAGLVLQDSEAQIIGLTVEEDLAFGPENYAWPAARIRAAIPALLKLVRLEGFAARETFGLSGGQKQRVSLAGALMLAPQVLILDEPTSELDPVGKAEVFDALCRLRRESNVTIIVIEHAVDLLAQVADRILLMDHGRIVADAPPQELFRNVALFHVIGGERIPQAAELLFGLEQDGLIGAGQFSSKEGDAIQVVARLLSPEAAAVPGAHHPGQARAEPTSQVPVRKPGQRPIIEIADVSHRYKPTDVAVLDHVNLVVERGEFVALIGQNGAGKTTLAKTFNGLLTPTSGEVLIDGRSSRTGLEQLARVVGYVYQNPDHQIFARTVRDEIAFGPKNLGLSQAEIDEAVNRALALVELQHAADEYPFLLGRGQRQKLAVASVIAMDPQVLVVDEPTTGLDLRGSQSIMRLLGRWNAEGRTIVIITHDMDIVAEFATRTVVMAKGRVLKDGPTRTVLTDQALLAQAFLSPPQITRIAQGVAGRTSFPSEILSVAEFRWALEQELTSSRSA